MDKWLITPASWDDEYKSLLLQESVDGTQRNKKLNEIITKSKKFPIKFPINSMRCQELLDKVSKEQLEDNINSVYPVIHEYGLLLCAMFLSYQRKHGTNKEFYKNLTLFQLIDRLLTKRAVMFYNTRDKYMLLNGTKGAGKWESIGTKNEKPPLVLDQCLSYDEIRLSALLSVSSHSYFINDGDRFNSGAYEKDRNKVQENGVIIGVIGARLKKRFVMEYRDVIKSREQNSGNEVSIDRMFFKFYGEYYKTFDQIKEEIKLNPARYIMIEHEKYFDRTMYEKRIAISIDTLLIEANYRAKQLSKKAYVHVVGLGLGVWKMLDIQDEIFMAILAQRLEVLSSVLPDISDVRLAYIRAKFAGKYKHGDKINHIKIHIENKNPHDKLIHEDAGKLLVECYPWDGNALPGNEFWGGITCGSGDSAAASSSQITELHNPHINDKVSSRNLKIVTSKGLFSIKEYQNLLSNKNNCL